MNIPAGQAITEALQHQRDRDQLALIAHEVVTTWNRMTHRLANAGWADPLPVDLPTTLHGQPHTIRHPNPTSPPGDTTP